MMKRREVDRECERIAKEINRVWGGSYVRLFQEFNAPRGPFDTLGSWSAVIVNPGDHETSVGGHNTRLGAMRALLRVAKREMDE